LIQQRLSEQGLTVRLTEAARKELAREGFDPAFGARPLHRALQKHIESPVSVKLLQGGYKHGDTIVADFQEGKGIFLEKDK
jgi:ATP-dependent Clp protease ATP-binding subunit ClpC